MTDLIDQIKLHFNLAAFVAPYTNGLRRPQQTNYGEYLNGWCPWCQNGKPQRNKARRFWVNIETQKCNCMHPTCKSIKDMDVINFHARLWGLTNKEAIEDLRLQMLGVEVQR